MSGTFPPHCKERARNQLKNFLVSIFLNDKAMQKSSSRVSTIIEVSKRFRPKQNNTNKEQIVTC